MDRCGFFGIYQARCGEGTVILNLEDDSYACRYDGPSDEMSDACAAPRQSPWREAEPRHELIRPGDVLLFLRAYGAALAAFPRRPLRALMGRALRLAHVSRRHAPSPLTLAARFERLSLYLPWRPPCLLRSFALLHYLALHGHGADWIIGVQLFPFRAHCWLAIDDLLLAERAHLIEDYVPIYRMQGR